MGESALSIPAKELSSLVSASAKSIAGIKFPTMPVKNTTFHFPFGIRRMFLSAKGSMNKKAKDILIVPT